MRRRRTPQPGERREILAIVSATIAGTITLTLVAIAYLITRR